VHSPGCRGAREPQPAAPGLRAPGQLTQREREVLDLVVAGKLNREVAEELAISVKTVEAHRAKIMEKLEVDSLAELVQAALLAGSHPAPGGGPLGFSPIVGPAGAD
jgi:FixJ family two-component response regulator